MDEVSCNLQCLPFRRWPGPWSKALLVFLLPVTLYGWSGPRAQQAKSEIEEINSEFHFLGANDALLIHEEEGTLKGQIDVYQSEEESDAVLSYTITIGSRKSDHVEFKTAKIHRKYFRFAGEIERGSGHTEKDADYLRLVGDLEIITMIGERGQENVERKHVILKAMSASERVDE